MKKTGTKSAPRLWKRLLALLLLLAFLAAGAALIGHIRDDMEERRTEAIREAVEAAALQCYAVEGVYPEKLSYLEQNYGVMIDHDRYIVSYETYAGNRAPKVMVLKK